MTFFNGRRKCPIRVRKSVLASSCFLNLLMATRRLVELLDENFFLALDVPIVFFVFVRFRRQSPPLLVELVLVHVVVRLPNAIHFKMFSSGVKCLAG